jgi:hypothetical protein
MRSFSARGISSPINGDLPAGRSVSWAMPMLFGRDTSSALPKKKRGSRNVTQQQRKAYVAAQLPARFRVVRARKMPIPGSKDIIKFCARGSHLPPRRMEWAASSRLCVDVAGRVPQRRHGVCMKYRKDQTKGFMQIIPRNLLATLSHTWQRLCNPNSQGFSWIWP